MRKPKLETVLHEVRVYNAQGKLKKKITQSKILKQYQSVYATRSEDCFNEQILQVTRKTKTLREYHKEQNVCYEAHVNGCQ